MNHSRRSLLACLIAGLVAPTVLAHPGPHHHPHHRARRAIRRRRIWRHRVRRHVAWRVFGPRRLLVVPLAVAVGWELFVDDRVVVVKEVHEHKVIVEHSDGKTEEIEVHKEDTADNTQEHEGSKYEAEEEVEDGG